MILRVGEQLHVDGRSGHVVAIESDRVTIRLADDTLLATTVTELAANPNQRFRFDDVPAVDPFMLSAADQQQVPRRFRKRYNKAAVGFEWARRGVFPIWSTAKQRAPYPDGVSTVDARIATLVRLGIASSQSAGYRRYRRYWEGDWRGSIGLAALRTHRAHRSVDDAYLREARLLAERLRKAGWSTCSAKHFLELLSDQLQAVQQDTGEEIAVPKQSTRYAVIKEALHAAGILYQTIKTQEGKAASSKHEFGRIEATRLGQYVLIDTYRFDTHAISPFTAKWAPVEVTAAMDLGSRRIVGYRIAPWATGATDIALLLFDMFHPRREPWAFHTGKPMPSVGVPDFLLINSRTGQWPADDGSDSADLIPTIRPETFVLDNGKVFTSQQVRSVCNANGISILEGRLIKADDKAQIEAFFNTLRVDIAERLLGHRGNNPTRHGRSAEVNAVYLVEEIDAIIRTYTLDHYHNTVHAGLHRFGFPNEHCTPNEKFMELMARGGVRLTNHSAEQAMDLLPIAWARVQKYGVKVKKLVYDGDALKPLNGVRSRYTRRGGRWPIAYNPLDRQYAYIQDAVTGSWHTLRWIGHAAFSGPFSSSLMRYSVRRFQGAPAPRFYRTGNDNLVADALNSFAADVADAADVPRELDAIFMRMAGFKDVFRRFHTTVTAFRDAVHIVPHRNVPKHRAEPANRAAGAGRGTRASLPVAPAQPQQPTAPADVPATTHDDYYKDVR